MFIFKKIGLILIIFILSACGRVSYAEEGLLVNKKANNVDTCRTTCTYSLTIEKDGEQLNLVTTEKSIFTALTIGSTLNVKYNAKFEIIDVRLPKFETEIELPKEHRE